MSSCSSETTFCPSMQKVVSSQLRQQTAAKRTSAVNYPVFKDSNATPILKMGLCMAGLILEKKHLMCVLTPFSRHCAPCALRNIDVFHACSCTREMCWDLECVILYITSTSWSEQISGVKVYQADKTPEEVIMECDFMWAGQQVHMPALSQLPSLSDCVSSNPRCVKLTHSTVILT